MIAIIGILTTIGIGNFQTARLKARDVQRKADLTTIAKSIEAYASDYKSYPNSDGSGKIICIAPNTICDFGAPLVDANSTVYAAKLPTDPTPANNGYYYESDGTSYTIYATLENSLDPALVDPTTLNKTCNSLPCNYSLKSPNQI